jgi:hypothetical protein
MNHYAVGTFLTEGLIPSPSPSTMEKKFRRHFYEKETFGSSSRLSFFMHADQKTAVF